MNPSDIDFAKFIADISNRLGALEKTPQPFLGDWLEILNPIEVVSGKVCQFVDTELDPRNFFSLGDKIRWKEDDGEFKYGYIFEISETTFNLINDDYLNGITGTITQFSRGIASKPIGHPIRFHNQSLQSNGDFTVAIGSVTAGKIGVDWWMDGAVINIIGTNLGTGNQAITTSGASTFNITMRMPWFKLNNNPESSGYVNYSTPKPLIVNQGLEAHGQISLTTLVELGTIFTLCVVFQRTGLASWGSSTYDVDFDLRSMPYNLTNI